MFNKILLPFLIFLLLPVMINAQEVLEVKKEKEESGYGLTRRRKRRSV